VTRDRAGLLPHHPQVLGRRLEPHGGERPVADRPQVLQGARGEGLGAGDVQPERPGDLGRLGAAQDPRGEDLVGGLDAGLLDPAEAGRARTACAAAVPIPRNAASV
jgi:hypothetical protein